jgi:hypothetical protein
VGDRDAIVVEQASDERRAHALALRLGLGRLIDDLVRAENRVSQHDRLPHQADSGIDFSAIFSLASLPDQIKDGLNGNAAGNFTGIVATHAVGEYP